MAVRTVAVRLVADTGQYTSNIDKASKSTDKLADSAERTQKKHRAAWDQIGRGAGVAAVVGVAAVGAMVKSFMDFDSTMSQVQAATGETGASLDQLRKAALDAGKATVFSATEAAAAETELSKAGVSTADILGGALTGSLDLAAAGQLGVADAAGIAATAMTQFGLSGKDVPHIADLLAAGAGKAQGEVSDLAVALKYVGPVAHQMGISIEETTGVLAELASNGILADQAGTSLRGMLSALTSPSAKAADSMQQLGIDVYDTSGNFIGFDGVAGQLHDRLGKLTNAQRDQALGTIFGNEQITAARILYAGGADAVHKWTGEVNDAGFAQEQAAAKLDNLSGDLEALRGSIETALIQGGSAANSTLRTLVSTATGAVNVFASLPGPMQATAVGMIAVTAAGGGALALFGSIVPRVRAYRTELEGMGRVGSVANTAIGVGGRVLGASLPIFALAATAIEIYNRKKQESAQRVKDFTDAILADSGALGENTQKLASHTLEQTGALQAGQMFGINLHDLTDAVLGNQDALGRVNAVLDTYKQQTAEAASAGDNNNVSTRDSDEAYTRLRDTLGLTTGEVHKAVDAARREAEAQGQVKNSTDVVAATTKGYTGTVRDATGALDQFDTAADAVKASIDALNGTVIAAGEADIDFRNAVARATSALHDNGRTLDLNTQKGRDNRTAIINAIKAANQHAQAVADQTGSVDRGTKAFNDDIAALHRVVGGSSQAKGSVNALIDSYGRVPAKTTGAAKGFDSAGRSAATAASKMNAATRAANGIPRSVTTRVTAVVSVVDAISANLAPDSSITRRNTTGSGSGRATGGWVPGHSPGDYSDNIPATINGQRPLWLTGEEFVINRPRAREIRRKSPGLLEAINAGAVDIGGDPAGMVARYGKPLRFAAGGSLADAGMGAPMLWSSGANRWLTEGGFAAFNRQQESRRRQAEMRTLLATGRMVRWRDVDPATWQSLIRAGWRGRSDDGIDALYAPAGQRVPAGLTPAVQELYRAMSAGRGVSRDLSFRGESSYYRRHNADLARAFHQRYPGLRGGALERQALYAWAGRWIRRVQSGKSATDAPLGFAAGGNIPAVQRWMRSADPLPYVWGAVGPNAYDCSGLAGEAYARLTGRPSWRRYFTTASNFASLGFRRGLGTFTLGLNPGHHMDVNLAGYGGEAQSTATGIKVGRAATPVTRFAQQWFLPEMGGRFVAAGGSLELTGRQKREIFGMIRPQIAKMVADNLRGRAAGGPVTAGELYRVNERGQEGFFVPPSSGQIVPAAGMTARSVQPAGSGDRMVASIAVELSRLRAALVASRGPLVQVEKMEMHDRVDVDLLVGQLDFAQRAGSFT